LSVQKEISDLFENAVDDLCGQEQEKPKTAEEIISETVKEKLSEVIAEQERKIDSQKWYSSYEAWERERSSFYRLVEKCNRSEYQCGKCDAKFEIWTDCEPLNYKCRDWPEWKLKAAAAALGYRDIKNEYAFESIYVKQETFFCTKCGQAHRTHGVIRYIKMTSKNDYGKEQGKTLEWRNSYI
jgi:hypothetical protein